MTEKIHKLLSIFVVSIMLFGNVAFAFADDAPVDITPSPAQTQSTDTSSQTQPTSEVTPAQQPSDVTPTPPVTASITPIPMPTNIADELKTKTTEQVVAEIKAKNDEKRAAARADNDAQKAKAKSSAPTPTPSTGSSSIAPTTGTGTSISDTPSGAVINSGNGEGSTNTGSSDTNNTTNTDQNNSANVNTGLTQSAVTGGNSAHDNLNGNVTVKSGDANVSGTAITAVNSNANNVTVSEFNVDDVQNGDLVLDPTSHCISGCGSTAQNVVVNTGNGTGSTNTAASDTNNTNNTFQNNDANIGTDLTLVANSGGNRAHDNSGNTDVESGNANVSANALTLANNNIDGGQVQYYTVNIYGELHGDIILPEEVPGSTPTTGSNGVANTGNGADSANTASSNTTNTSNTSQSNNANLNNNLNLTAGTGNNSASDNGGSADVTSGKTNVVANVLNIANSNIDGQGMWLVIVNEAGKWVGKILGGNGSNMAGSNGTEFVVNDDGSVSASNNGNAQGSTNTASSNTNNTDNTTQTNNANVNNTLNLTANTGDNKANDNLGGSNTVKSGDATIIANLVNFVNNNITGGGSLRVLVVNVFGKFFGDIVTPGQTKQSNQGQSSQNNSSNSNNTTDSSNNHSAATTNTTAVLGASAVNTTSSSNTQTGGSTLSTGNGSNTSANVLVAGASTLVKGSQFKNTLTNNVHEISVNLAWMLIMMPVLGIFALGRRIVKRRATA
ncbi:hypothetical protein BH09PAT1_BH09PAT1_0550 [soil metagenome]